MTGGRGARNARLFEKMWARRADERDKPAQDGG